MSMILSEHERITILLAIYGAIVSTFAVAVQVVQALRDRVRVVIEIGIVVAFPDPTKRTYIEFRITNVGNRPVTITTVGGRTWRPWKGHKEFAFNFFVPDPWIKSEVVPKKLGESETVVLVTPELDSVFKIPWSRYLAAYDSAGRVWKVRCNNWRRVKRRHQDLRKQSKR